MLGREDRRFHCLYSICSHGALSAQDSGITYTFSAAVLAKAYCHSAILPCKGYCFPTKSAVACPWHNRKTQIKTSADDV